MVEKKEETKFVEPPKQENKKAPEIKIVDPDKELRAKLSEMIDAASGKTVEEKRKNYALIACRSVHIASHLGLPKNRVRPILNSILKTRIESL